MYMCSLTPLSLRILLFLGRLQMANCLNGAAHGPVHIQIGGAWNEGDLFDDTDISFLEVLAAFDEYL